MLSYYDGQIRAVGVARSNGYTAPKPDEFGQRGAHWDLIGWRVDVDFTRLAVPLRPVDVMDLLGPLLPERYAPLRANGMGLQNLYLTSLPEPFARAALDLLGPMAQAIVAGHVVEDRLQTPAIGLEEWEDHEEDVVRGDPSFGETTRTALIQARRGQGAFKEQVRRLEKRCRITGVDRIEHLRASHCKPWRDATNDERLDGENGLLLTPTIDHLFDRGFIGFEDDGTLIVSPVAHRGSLLRMGIETERVVNVGTFSSGQRAYLDFHREAVLLKARMSSSLRPNARNAR